MQSCKIASIWKKSDFAADTPANKKSPLEGTGGKDKERSPYYE
nr:MAG TPA: hypothetical protein [Caudoviricetes sp.]